ncbi:MAG: class IV adenylate cyclase [Psychrobium sp.]
MTIEHFKGQFEVELKYRIASPQAFKSALADVPHQIRFEDNNETDWYYDTDSHSLRKESKHLLLRDIQPTNIQLWIVKGPGGDDCEASDILDLGAAKNMLSTLGYQLTLTMSKTRSIYFVGEYHITFDYLEGLGYFAEFAIMTDDESSLEYHRQQLISLAARFSLDHNELEHHSYRTLFESLNE